MCGGFALCVCVRSLIYYVCMRDRECVWGFCIVCMCEKSDFLKTTTLPLPHPQGSQELKAGVHEYNTAKQCSVLHSYR